MPAWLLLCDRGRVPGLQRQKSRIGARVPKLKVIEAHFAAQFWIENDDLWRGSNVGCDCGLDALKRTRVDLPVAIAQVVFLRRDSGRHLFNARHDNTDITKRCPGVGPDVDPFLTLSVGQLLPHTYSLLIDIAGSITGDDMFGPQTGFSMAFLSTNEVPEPSSLILFVIAILGVAVHRIRISGFLE